MHPYKQSNYDRLPPGCTGIEQHLFLLDEAILCIERARRSLAADAGAPVAELILKGQLAVTGLALQCNPQSGEVSTDLVRLYEFCLHCLAGLNPEKLAGAAQVLKTLRSGFEETKGKAMAFELGSHESIQRSESLLRIDV